MTEAKQTLTPEQVKAEFERQGVSIADWARDNGFPPPLVYRVLNGASPKRGTSHKIAVELGIKEGNTNGLLGLSFAKTKKASNSAL